MHNVKEETTNVSDSLVHMGKSLDDVHSDASDLPTLAPAAWWFVDAFGTTVERRRKRAQQAGFQVPLPGFLIRVVPLLTGSDIGPPHKILFEERVLLLKKFKNNNNKVGSYWYGHIH